MDGLATMRLSGVAAPVNFTAPMSEKPYSYNYDPPAGVPVRNTENEAHTITVRDARAAADALSLDREGFVLVHHKTEAADLYDEEIIAKVYYPECERLMRQATGAKRVVAFDHIVRNAAKSGPGSNVKMPAGRVHNDYTAWSAPQRVRDLMGDEAEELLKHRFAIVQCWRPIRLPVESWPLAICDSQTLDPKNMVVTERRYQDRVGQTAAITFDPGHRWYWFPHMRRDEALVFKVYESMTDGRARWTAHTAFDDPTSPPNARFRESIEIRTLAFF